MAHVKTQVTLEINTIHHRHHRHAWTHEKLLYAQILVFTVSDLLCN